MAKGKIRKAGNPEANTRLEVLSLGAGVQSSAILLMSDAGLLPRLDAAIFADTGAEPDAVYEWLDWLEEQVTIPVYRVKRWADDPRTLESEEGTKRVSKTTGNRYVQTSVPMWTTTGQSFGGSLRRKCTRDFKIHPVQKKLRALCGITRKRAGKEVLARQWIGISTDEAHRMKPSREP